MGGYVPVSAGAHGGLRWSPPADWRFAGDAGLVPCTMHEAAALATALPLVFSAQDTGRDTQWQLMALLRLTPGGATPLIDAQGRWCAGQIPQALRLYPFDAAPVGDGRLALLVNEDSGLLGPDGAHALFDETGAPGPELAQLLQLFERRAAALTRTGQAIAALEVAGLLCPLTLPEAGDTGLFVIDAAALQALPGADLGALHDRGADGLAYVQIVSMHTLPWLRKMTLHAQSSTGAAVAPDLPGTAPPNAADFISALAEAQDDDMTDSAARFLSGLAPTRGYEDTPA